MRKWLVTALLERAQTITAVAIAVLLLWPAVVALVYGVA